MEPEFPLAPSGPTFDQPGMRLALWRQMRSLRVVASIAVVMVAGIVTGAVFLRGGSAGLVVFLCVLGLVASGGTTFMWLTRYDRIRSVLRTYAWRPVDGVWSRDSRSDVLLRDPSTGEQAAMHATAAVNADPDVRLKLWFAGDLRHSGVVTAVGGGRLYLVIHDYTETGRRGAVRTREWLVKRCWPRSPQAILKAYEISDLEQLRTYGYAPATSPDGVPESSDPASPVLDGDNNQT